MLKADCPSCGAQVTFGIKPKVGQKVKCLKCNTELEVVWLEPIELDFPYDDEGDDEDYDDDSDDEEPY